MNWLAKISSVLCIPPSTVGVTKLPFLGRRVGIAAVLRIPVKYRMYVKVDSVIKPFLGLQWPAGKHGGAGKTPKKLKVAVAEMASVLARFFLITSNEPDQ